MNFSKLLLWLFAVTYAAASPSQLPLIHTQGRKVIRMRVFPRNSASITPNPDKRVARRSLFFVDNISSNVLPHQVQSITQYLGWNRISQTVVFDAYYRAPSLIQNNTLFDEVTMVLRFTFLPRVTFEWDLRPNDRNFEYIGKWGEPDGMILSYYKVIAPPGSVFPIRLTVMKAKRYKRFSVLWLTPMEEAPQGSQAPQPVELWQAKVLETRPWHLGPAPPTSRLIHNTLGNVLLAHHLVDKAIETYAAFSRNKRHFLLTGYFQPRQEKNRFVLSSDMPVGVEIHVRGDNKEYTVYSLKALSGDAWELKQALDSDTLYKVVILGKFSSRLLHGITLMVFDSSDVFNSTPVELVIPNLKDTVQTRPLTWLGHPDVVPDLIDFYPEPISGTVDHSDLGLTSIDGESEYSFSEGYPDLDLATLDSNFGEHVSVSSWTKEDPESWVPDSGFSDDDSGNGTGEDVETNSWKSDSSPKNKTFGDSW